MDYKLLTSTQFPALVQVQPPLTLSKVGMSYTFSVDVPALASSVAAILTVGTAAGADTGTSGHKVPFLDGINTWSATQTISKNAASLPAIGTPSGVTGTAQVVMSLGGADSTAADLFIQSFGAAASVRHFSSAGTAAAPLASTNGSTLAANFAYGYTGSAYVAAAGFNVVATETFSGAVSGSRLDISATPTGSTGALVAASFGAGVMVGDTIDPGAGAISATKSILSKGATFGIGYATGAGGTVTQITNKSTGVTLSKASGQITMVNSALAAGTIVSFVLTNSAIAANDVLILNHISGGTPGSYLLNARCGAGSATIDVRNNTAGSLGEAIVIQFALIKAVTA